MEMLENGLQPYSEGTPIVFNENSIASLVVAALMLTLGVNGP